MATAADPASRIDPVTPAQLLPLSAVRLLDQGPFAPAVAANRTYVLALDADRLLAPFRREAGLPAKAQPYGNWESSGLDGHTAGHYLSALAHMIASGEDTPDGQLRSRLTYMLGELQACHDAFGDGYLGGVPGSRELWHAIAGGDVAAINKKWVPWYNVHKTLAGLRDAYLEAGDATARALLVRLGDWCVAVTSGLSDEQMQQMLGMEHGGMNETLADIYAITGDTKYLATAKRFNHKAVLDPLVAQRDELTGKHANTQIPKVIGLERIATLTGDKAADSGARFFWENVTQHRSVAFGGNSVSEHFNDPKDFHGLLGHREGPETCNTYNMLRLTEQLFAAGPSATYADFYERALYNHILASINPQHPGYVYFTPIRPAHYRVYSEVQNSFWCCVGTGMENPGKYGEFIYARAADGLYVNLFIASEVTAPELGLVLRQETAFPDEETSRLTLKLAAPRTFTLHVRVPGWVGQGAFSIKINGELLEVSATPSSYIPVRREWKNGDRVELALPMRTTVEQLPDGSPWYAIMRGPLVLAAPSGTWDMTGLRADDSRMAHVAAGPVLPLDNAPSLLADAATIPAKVVAEPAAGPLHFRLVDIVEPAAPQGVPLVPFFRLHDSRYQMYWEATTREALAARKEQLAAAERALAAREAATLDRVSPGEQQPEVEHAYLGEETESGLHNGRHWRHGKMIEYTLNTRGEKNVALSVTYSGSDSGRQFDIFANGVLVATQDLVAERIGEFVDKQYAIPAAALASATDGRVTIRFVAKKGLAGGLFDVRLLRTDPAPTADTLWYAQPAVKWEEALPVGNGRLGAMVFGGVATERLQLNEGTLWAGGPYDPVNPEAKAALPEVRRLIDEGRYKEADALLSAKVMAKPLKQMPYQTVGDLLLTFADTATVGDYRRELDLDSATTSVAFTREGVRYTREVFASALDNVIVVRLAADRPGKISFAAGMKTPMAATVSTSGGDTLVMDGRGGDSDGIKGRLRYQARVKILATGGTVTADAATVTVAGADEVTLLVAAATSFKRFDDVSGDPAALTSATLASASGKSLAALRADHLADYRTLFRRVTIDLGRTEAMKQPTDVRIARFAEGGDPQLAALYYQYGRYLLISCSRPGGQAATLQGLWNASMTPPWECKYTININTEMNYWPAESGNLAECVEPLVAMVQELAVTGARTAQSQYGARGWMAHHNTDIWRATAPIDGPFWGMWPTGGAWLCLHLWDRYQFSGDRAAVERFYPLMKGAAEFFLDTLQPEPKHGWLVTNPSISPENAHPAGTSVCAGPTMDMQILRDLFANTIEAATTLGVDADLRARLAAARAKLAPNQIGSAGQLQEWMEDWDLQAPDRNHRHVSHLYGLFPGRDFNRRDNPDLAAAARKSLEIRGDRATGWATAWRFCLWTHLGDGDHAFEILKFLLSPERTYPNMFDAHPPFQIDGNFGGAAGIVEMLVQSRPGEIEFLPALPAAWPTGSVKGLRARGGFEVDVAWRDGKHVEAAVRALKPGSVRLRRGEVIREVTLAQGETFRWDGR